MRMTRRGFGSSCRRMGSEWECLRLAAKASDREGAFRDHWPAVEAQLRQWGYPSWGIAQAHRVLSSGGSVTEAAKALRNDEALTEAGRARFRRLERIADRWGLALRRSAGQALRPVGSCCWTIVDPRTNTIVAPTESAGRPAMNLDEVEAWLAAEQT